MTVIQSIPYIHYLLHVPIVCVCNHKCTYFETIARRRSAALLSGFGLGHVREYAPSTLTLLCVPGALRAPCRQRLASHPLCKVSAHLKQMCENGTSCNILIFRFALHELLIRTSGGGTGVPNRTSRTGQTSQTPST